MNFRQPWVLFFIPVIFLLAYLIKKKQDKPAFCFSSIKLLAGLGGTLRSNLGWNIIYLRCAALGLMLLALARPQSPLKESIKRAEGVDMVLTIDVSTSMLAEDFTIKNKRYNRLDVVKQVVPEFVKERKNDRLAAVVFGARAYTVCPLTLNHGWLLESLSRVYPGMLEDRTAIGSAIASSLNRLKKSRAKGKAVILLTDGRNNAGKITPLTAAEIARALNVKVYTIGAGTFGSVPYPIKNPAGEIIGYETMRIDMDEDLLRQIASQTGAKYYRATDAKSLKKIYEEIDRLEKTPIEEKGYEQYQELFAKFLIPGLFILLLEVFLSNTILRRIP